MPRHVSWRAVIFFEFFFEFFLNFFNEKSSRSRTKKVPCRFLFMKLKLVHCIPVEEPLSDDSVSDSESESESEKDSD